MRRSNPDTVITIVTAFLATTWIVGTAVAIFRYIVPALGGW